MTLKKRIASAVDGAVYRHALFYNFPGGLRFELSEGGSALDQVLCALRKASSICSDAFEHAATILVHIQSYSPTSRFALRDSLRELALAGISVPRNREIWLEKSVEDAGSAGEVEEDVWINAAFELPKSKLQNLLWCATVTDFWSVRPNPQCRIYLVHPSAEIVVHPYDHRGMDIIGKDKAALERLFKSHNTWLLEHDIATMSQTFL